MTILSLCIATFNRAAFIGETLDSLIAQATAEVEIVIVDGGSTDNTAEVVQQRQQRFPRLNYLRLEAKGGVDQDYCRAVDRAQGDYCWLMSDDDILKPGAMQAVLAATRQAYGLIIVNAEVRSVDFSRLIVPGLLPTPADQVYTPAESHRLFVETATYLSFIGCVVIKRQLWNSREKEMFFGSEFIHVGVIFQSPLPENTQVIAKPWIIIRHGNASWTSKYFHIWMLKWPNLIWSFPDYPDAAKRRVVPRDPWRQPKILLILRAKGAFSLQEYRQFLETRLESPRERFIARTIARLPGCLVNLPIFIYFSLFRSHELYGLQEFRDSRFFIWRCLRGLFRRAPQART